MPKHSQDGALRWTGETGFYLSIGIVLGPVSAGKSRWRLLVHLAGCEKSRLRVSRIKSAYRCVRDNLCFLGVGWGHSLWLGKSTEMHFWDVLKLLQWCMRLSSACWGEVRGLECRAKLLCAPCTLHLHRGLFFWKVRQVYSCVLADISVRIRRNDTILSKIQRCCGEDVKLELLFWKSHREMKLIQALWGLFDSLCPFCCLPCFLLWTHLAVETVNKENFIVFICSFYVLTTKQLATRKKRLVLT